MLANARLMLVACLNAPHGPLKVLFAPRTQDPHAYTPEEIHFAGTAWGDWLNDLANGPGTDPELAALVVGFSVQNAWCNKIIEVYQAVLNATDPPDPAAAEAAADEEAEAQTNVIIHFCRGLRDTYPAVWRVPAGLPSNLVGQVPCLSRLTTHYFPDNGSTPALNAVGVHWYRNAGDFDIDPGPPMTVTPKPPTFTARMDDLLSGAGLPSTTPVFIQETNVDQLSFGWDPGGGAEESQTPEFVAAHRAMGAQMDAMYGDGRVRWVGPFSPWAGGGERFLIQIPYVGLPGPFLNTPSGAAVKDYVPPSS